MHTIEKKEEPSVFAQGITGWKYLFSLFKKKSPDQQTQQGNQQPQQNNNSNSTN